MEDLATGDNTGSSPKRLITREETKSPKSLITRDQVNTALITDKGKDAQLLSWEIKDFTKRGDNHNCVVTSIEVKYALNNESFNVSYVVKLNPNRSFKTLGDMTHTIFVNEGKCYQCLIPELNRVLEAAGKEALRFPQCFNVHLEDGKEQIYFEDLRTRGFEMYDRRKGLDVEHTSLVLEELAKLHAASYLLQVSSPGEPLEVRHDYLLKDLLSFTDNCEEFMVQAMQVHLTNTVGMLEKIGGYGKAITWVESLKPKIAAILSTDMKSDVFGVLCHGDCWNNNILFRYDDGGSPVEVMLVDLQVCRKASLATDLNYFLFTSLTGDVRKPNLKRFLSTYRSSFKEVMDTRGLPVFFNEEELLQEYHRRNTWGAFAGMMIIPGILVEPEDVPEMSGEDIDWEEVMKEFKDKAMDSLDSNPLLKPRFLAIFDELLENGLI